MVAEHLPRCCSYELACSHHLDSIRQPSVRQAVKCVPCSLKDLLEAGLHLCQLKVATSRYIPCKGAYEPYGQLSLNLKTSSLVQAQNSQLQQQNGNS